MDDLVEPCLYPPIHYHAPKKSETHCMSIIKCIIYLVSNTAPLQKDKEATNRFDKHGDEGLSLSRADLRDDCVELVVPPAVEVQQVVAARQPLHLQALVPLQAALLHRRLARQHAKEVAHRVLREAAVVAAHQVVDQPAAPAVLTAAKAPAPEEAGESAALFLEQTAFQAGDGRLDFAEAAAATAAASEAVEEAAIAPAAAEKSAEVESARLSRSSAQIPEEAPDELKFCRLDGADDILHEADNL